MKANLVFYSVLFLSACAAEVETMKGATSLSPSSLKGSELSECIVVDALGVVGFYGKAVLEPLVISEVGLNGTMTFYTADASCTNTPSKY